MRGRPAGARSSHTTAARLIQDKDARAPHPHHAPTLHSTGPKMTTVESRSPPAVPSRALPLFFAITWGVVGFYIAFPETAVERFGAIHGGHPAFFLATWSPAIAAFALVLRYGGVAGLRAFLSRLRLWRCPPGWAAFVVLGLPLVFVAGSMLKGGPLLTPSPTGGLPAMLGVMVMMLFLGPVEEFGWRGVAQPILQRHVAPIWAGLAIGAVWGFWHLPAFFLSGTAQSEWAFAPFFLGNVVLAVLVTPLFNAARGSLFWPMLFHWQLINPFWPDAQPWDTGILAAIAVIVVWRNRDTMFSRDGTVVDVIPVVAGGR